MTHRIDALKPLARLGSRLGRQGVTVSLTDEGLRVSNPPSKGCCPDNPHLADLITMRTVDGKGEWFFTSWGDPIAPVARIAAASERVRDYLAVPAPEVWR